MSRPSKAKARANGSAKQQVEEKPLEVHEHDFFWTYTEEPHRTRRQAIIKAHPEVRSGDDPSFHLHSSLSLELVLSHSAEQES